ncbi:variant surface antigen E-like [Penaeus monodon]|uniref:variant surface antigen E-like n=1 Tax=Penaeus monodon TaxID=6687 RepID=UPI0018A7BDBC|nr:variant surface antigen E-like [Penaeus monodon]
MEHVASVANKTLSSAKGREEELKLCTPTISNAHNPYRPRPTTPNDPRCSRSPTPTAPTAHDPLHPRPQTPTTSDAHDSDAPDLRRPRPQTPTTSDAHTSDAQTSETHDLRRP